MDEKWIVQSRAFLAMLAPLLAWAVSNWGAPEGTSGLISESIEWVLAGAGLVAYGLHLFKPDNATTVLVPPAILPPKV